MASSKYRQERGNLAGDQVIADAYELLGKISGNVRVVDGGKAYLRGAIYGDLTVEAGGRVHVYGHISGDLVVHADAKVIHSGRIGGNATNQGGRLYIDRDGEVTGKVRTVDGETKVEKKKPAVKADPHGTSGNVPRGTPRGTA